MIVVKVGGSLFDHPRLGPGLRAYLDSLAPADVLLVPGGGPVAGAVREVRIDKSGFERFVSLAAHRWPVSYGLVAVALSLAIGWGAGQLFRRG